MTKKSTSSTRSRKSPAGASDLPKRVPDTTAKMMGAFQGLLGEFIRTSKNALQHIEDPRVREELVAHTHAVHIEALDFMKEIGAEVESQS